MTHLRHALAAIERSRWLNLPIAVAVFVGCVVFQIWPFGGAA